VYYERIEIGNLHFAFDRLSGKVVQFESEEEAISVCGSSKKIDDSIYEEISTEICHPTCLTITVELNNICNLKCVYCYQTQKGVRPEITIDYIDKLLQYIRLAYNANHFRILILRFIGGEPMLSVDKMLYCYTEVKRFCDGCKVILLPHIDTNGTIPFVNVVRTIANLDTTICLSNKEDHNLKRSGSFDKILSNILKLSREEARHICVCYNVDHTNVDHFEQFLQHLNSLCPQINRVLTARIDDVSCRPHYVNQLTETEYARWNSTVAIDLLIKYGYSIPHCTSAVFSRCQGHSRYSCKIYSDGAITVCDAMQRDSSCLTIDELICDIDLLAERYKDIKKKNPLDDPECASCAAIIQCGGKTFCRSDKCNYQSEFNERAFIETYIKQTLMGNGGYFINM